MSKLLLSDLLGGTGAREAGCHENLPSINDNNIELLEPTAKENWGSGQQFPATPATTLLVPSLT